MDESSTFNFLKNGNTLWNRLTIMYVLLIKDFWLPYGYRAIYITITTYMQCTFLTLLVTIE